MVTQATIVEAVPPAIVHEVVLIVDVPTAAKSWGSANIRFEKNCTFVS